MNLEEMGRLMADQERFLRQMQPAVELARQLLRQMQPAVELARQHEESFKRVTEMAHRSRDFDAMSAAQALAARIAAVNCTSDRLGDVASVFPREELARLQDVAAKVRNSMSALPALDPTLLGGARNDRLADAVARLQERARHLVAAPDVGEPEDVESLAGDIDAVNAVTPAEAQDRLNRWLVFVLCFVLDAFAGDPAKEMLRDGVAKLLVVLLVTATQAMAPTPPLPPPASMAPETGAETTSEDSSEITPRAISELRRIAGLTWEELGRLFGVSRRSVHFWASGRPLKAVNEQRVRGVLDVVREADRGDARSNRTVLFEIAEGGTPFDLLALQRFDEARALLGPGPGRRHVKLGELDDAAKAERKPLPPAELIDALNDGVHHDVGQGRPARTVRNARRGLVG